MAPTQSETLASVTNNQSLPYIPKNIKNLPKKAITFEKNDSIKGKTHEMLRKGTCILLYLNVPKHPARDETSQYMSKTI